MYVLSVCLSFCLSVCLSAQHMQSHMAAHFKLFIISCLVACACVNGARCIHTNMHCTLNTCCAHSHFCSIHVSPHPFAHANMAIPAQHCDPPDARNSTIYDCLDESDDESDARHCKADNARLMALAERALSLQQSTSDRCTQLQQENQQLRQDNAKFVDLLQQQNQRATITNVPKPPTRSTKATNRCKRRSTKASKEPKPMGCYVVKAYALC